MCPLLYIKIFLLLFLLGLNPTCGDLDTTYFRVGQDAIIAVVGWPSNSPPILQAMLNSGKDVFSVILYQVHEL